MLGLRVTPVGEPHERDHDGAADEQRAGTEHGEALEHAHEPTTSLKPTSSVSSDEADRHRPKGRECGLPGR